MTTRDEYVDRMKRQLDEWNRDIDRLEAQAASGEARAKLRYTEQMEKARRRRDDLQQRLDELQRSSGDAWERMKGGVDEAGNALREALADARKELE